MKNIVDIIHFVCFVHDQHSVQSFPSNRIKIKPSSNKTKIENQHDTQYFCSCCRHVVKQLVIDFTPTTTTPNCRLLRTSFDFSIFIKYYLYVALLLY